MIEKGFATVWVVLITAVISLAVGAAGYAWYDQMLELQTTPVVTPPVSPSPQPSTPSPTPSTVPADWETYTNTKFGFSVKHPPTWKAPTTYGGVNTPGGQTYKIDEATAYEYVFTFIPPRIDDFPVIITVYEPSGADSGTSAVREKAIANQWDHCGGQNWPECKRDVTRKTITVSGDQALLVTVTATDETNNVRRDFVFIEKNARLYNIEHSGTSSSSDFELLYKSFTLTQ